MTRILETINLFKPLLITIIQDLWVLIKNQGLSFILLILFAGYQLQINREQEAKITELQNTIYTYLTVDKKEIYNAVIINNEVIKRSNEVIQDNTKTIKQYFNNKKR